MFGYELLFRESPEDLHFAANAENATGSTIDTLNLMGLDVVCDGRLGFINCGYEMLRKDHFLLLPPDKVVVEIQENVPPDASAVEACRKLKERGFRIALDNFSDDDPRQALLSYADVLKVDTRRFYTQRCAAMVNAYRTDERQLLAQKVESRLQFITAEKDGFNLFQGYFFRHPERMRARHIPGNQAGHLRLLKAISAPVPDLAAIEDLIKHDASLCYRLLRYLNSPPLGVSCPVQLVRHAMNLLGEQELVRWIRMATTLMMGQEKCSDLILSSLVRARFCELITPKVNHGQPISFCWGCFP